MKLCPIESDLKSILRRIGEDPKRSGLRETPKRAGRFWKEMAANIRISESSLVHRIKCFVEPDLRQDIVLIDEMEFYSVCEHHLLPFFGTVSIAYIPNGKGIISGLSKFPRTVRSISYRPQVQERIGSQLVAVLHKALDPKGVMVVIKAQHLCMRMRGIKDPRSTTQTISANGIFEHDARKRQEVLSLIR